MTTISFTKDELENLFVEYGMLVESCDLSVEDGEPRPDDGIIRTIYKKISNARFPSTKSTETLDQWRSRNYKHLDRLIGRSKWDRFRNPDYYANNPAPNKALAAD